MADLLAQLEELADDLEDPMAEIRPRRVAEELRTIVAGLRAATPTYPDKEETQAAMDREHVAGSATPTCNGMCHPASDFADGAPIGAIAYAHPECPLHGSATPTEEDPYAHYDAYDCYDEPPTDELLGDKPSYLTTGPEDEDDDE